MESVEDEEDEPVNMNIAPRNKKRVLELADGTDDSDAIDLPHAVVPAKKVSY
jgi:hypothetical protein